LTRPERASKFAPQFEVGPGPVNEVRLLAATVVIPARYGSTRFPAKILASETGKPLVQHVVDRAKRALRVREVIVATDDQRIVDALRPFETRCVMTSPAHQSGTDRIAEVARGLGDDIIVNVQGDEPEIEPEIIDALVERLESTTDDMATAATAFREGMDVADPNLVKVVSGIDGRAIYFSRSPVPFWRDRTGGPAPTYYLHLGIYAYRREFLLQFSSWPPTFLESTEKLEQLRALEHGRSIYVLTVDRATHGIDTAEQYADFVRRSQGSGARSQ
jgi:3-deoxy-manno-octulosonate cytidylyltransferase (CMP-KDO synthetase)